MKQIKINNFTDIVILFMYQDGWTENDLANKLDISPQTISNRIKYKDWRFDELRILKKLIKNRGYYFDI